MYKLGIDWETFETTPKDLYWTLYLSVAAELQGVLDRRLDGDYSEPDRKVLLPTPTEEWHTKPFTSMVRRCYSSGFTPYIQRGRFYILVPCPPDVDSAHREDRYGIQRIRDFCGV